MEEKIQTKFLIFQIIAFELGMSNSRNLDPDICHRESMF